MSSKNYDKLSLSDYTDYVVYLEGHRVPSYNLYLQSTIGQPPVGYVDIEYDSKLLSISYRNNVWTGLQPYTRIHIFSVVNNGPRRLLVAGLVTGVGALTKAHKYIRVNFMGELGLLSTITMMTYIPTQSVMLYVGQSAADAKNSSETGFSDMLSMSDKVVSNWTDNYDTLQTTIKESLCRYFGGYATGVLTGPPGVGLPADFSTGFIEGNVTGKILNKLLRLEYKFAFYRNTYIIDLLKSIFSDKVSPVSAIVRDLIDKLLPKTQNTTQGMKVMNNILAQLGMRYIPVINPTYNSDMYRRTITSVNGKQYSVGTILSGIGLPDLTLFQPAKGNIFFTDMTGSDSLPQYNFIGAPTRVAVTQTIPTVVDGENKTITLYGLAPALLRKKIKNAIATGASLGSTLLPSEYLLGQNVRQYPLNDWLSQELNINGNLSANKELKKSLLKYLNAKADYIYQEGYRLSATRNITLKNFQPYICVGLPGAIIGKGYISTGLVSGVIYNGAPGHIITTITLSGVHPYDAYSPNVGDPNYIDRNPLLKDTEKTDMAIETNIYKKYYGTTSYTNEDLSKIHDKFYGAIAYSPEAAVNYTQMVNRRYIATFDIVNKLLGYSIGSASTEGITTAVAYGATDIESIDAIKVREGAAFDTVRSEQIAAYIKRLRANHKGGL